MSKNIGERLSETSTKHVRTNRTYNENNKIRLEKLNNEPRMKVLGNVLYKTYLGDLYTFFYQDYPVTIKFDNTWQEYPETIANLLLKKLDEAAQSNTAKEVGTGDKI